MFRIVLLGMIVLFAVAYVTNARGLRRALVVVAGLLVVYAVLKMTGVIEALAPDRTGVY